MALYDDGHVMILYIIAACIMHNGHCGKKRAAQIDCMLKKVAISRKENVVQ